MKNKISTRISEAEWVVMEYIWDNPSSTALDVIYELRDKKEWNQRTIKSMLNRLVKKKILKTSAIGNRFLYTAIIPKEQAIQKESQHFIEKVFNGKMLPMLSYFVENNKLSKQDIKTLKKMFLKEDK